VPARRRVYLASTGCWLGGGRGTQCIPSTLLWNWPPDILEVNQLVFFICCRIISVTAGLILRVFPPSVKLFAVIGGSPRHGASSGCGRRNGLQHEG